MAMTLLRMCFANKLRHLARTVDCDIITPFAQDFDELLRKTVLGIVDDGEHSTAAGMDPSERAASLAHATRLIHRPIVRGGLAIPSTEAAVHAAYTASTFASLPLLHKMRDEGMAVPLPSSGGAMTFDHPMQRVRERWSTWAELASGRPYVPGGDVEATVPVPGSPPQSAETGDRLCTRVTTLSFDAVYQQAVDNELPKHLQHILTTLVETKRDDDYDAELADAAQHPSPREALNAAANAWSQHGKISPPLRLALLHSMSGPGHLWVLDTGTRRCSKGIPLPSSVASTMPDAPLSDYHMYLAIRMRLQLALGHVFALMRTASGRHSGDLQCFCSSNCTASSKCIDPHCLHLLNMAQGNLSMMTDRHHSVANLIFTLLKSAGFPVVSEQTFVNETLESNGDGTVTDEDVIPAHYTRMRMDLIADLSNAFLVKAGVLEPEAIASQRPLHPAQLPSTAALIDVSFIHPGPHLIRLYRSSGGDSGVLNPVGPGTLRDRFKMDKYSGAAYARNRQRLAAAIRGAAVGSGVPTSDCVLAPLSFSTYGRLYPSAEKFLDALYELVSTRRTASLDIDERPTTKCLHKRFTLRRTMSSVIMRCTIEGLLNATKAAYRRTKVPTAAGNGRWQQATTPSPPHVTDTPPSRMTTRSQTTALGAIGQLRTSCSVQSTEADLSLGSSPLLQGSHPWSSPDKPSQPSVMHASDSEASLSFSGYEMDLSGLFSSLTQGSVDADGTA